MQLRGRNRYRISQLAGFPARWSTAGATTPTIVHIRRLPIRKLVTVAPPLSRLHLVPALLSAALICVLFAYPALAKQPDGGPPGQAKQGAKAQPPGQAKKAAKAQPPGQAKKAAGGSAAKTPPGQAKKAAGGS